MFSVMAKMVVLVARYVKCNVASVPREARGGPGSLGLLTTHRWLRKKHPHTRIRDLAKQYGWHKPRRATLHWRDKGVVPASLAPLRVEHYRLAAERGPTYA